MKIGTLLHLIQLKVSSYFFNVIEHRNFSIAMKVVSAFQSIKEIWLNLKNHIFGIIGLGHMDDMIYCG